MSNLPPSSSLRCLRDPHCEKHEWHAGHMSQGRVKSDPKEDYENRTRSKEAGHKAFSIISNVEHYGKMQLTHVQKYMLYIFIKGELFLYGKNGMKI